jgi:hypothetical protein
MERIEIKGETITYKWKAIDGKIFDAEKDCKEYEENPITILTSKIHIHKTDLWDLCFGTEDDNVEIINGDKLDIFKYVSLKPSFRDKLKLEALNNILDERYSEDFIVMYNYDGNLFKGLWKQQIIDRMNNTIKLSKEQKENK